MRWKTFALINLALQKQPANENLCNTSKYAHHSDTKAKFFKLAETMTQSHLTSRRLFLTMCCLFGLPLIRPAHAQSELRGTLKQLPGANMRAEPGLNDRKRFMRLMRDAAASNQPLFLPPGTYPLADLDLPDQLHLTGAGPESRILFSGGESLLRGQNLRRLTLSNLALEGAEKPLGKDVQGLVNARNIEDLRIERCEITGSSKTGIYLERCRADIRDNRVTGAGDNGLWAIEGVESRISDNVIRNCGNGGILVHRWGKGADGTMVRDNRLSNIRADNGGTGPFGNAINIYQADDVSVSGNHIADSAFTAIRANAASNIQITGNHCLRSGETAIYCEFGFEGAVVADNLVDGAANGVSVVNFDQGGRLSSITGNIVRNIAATGPYVHDNVGFGFGIVAEADAVISANVVENIARFGMLIGWGPYLRNVVVNGNIVRDAQTGMAVSVVEEAGQAIITNNMFERVPKGAVIGYRWHDAATGDLLDGRNLPANVTVSGNRRS